MFRHGYLTLSKIPARRMFSHALVTAFPQAFAPSVSPLPPPPPPPRLAAEGASSKALYHRRLQQALDQRRAPVTGRFIGGALIEGTIYYDGRLMKGASQALPRRCLLTGASIKALHERRFDKGAAAEALEQRRFHKRRFHKRRLHKKRLHEGAHLSSGSRSI